MSKETGGPAFPVHPGMASALGCCPSSTDAGMTLRDYFAAKVLPVLISEAADLDEDDFPSKRRALSKEAYMWADSMLEARK